MADRTSAVQVDTAADQFSPAIEDNSFLIEEAYNQEEGVVQHISNGLYFNSPREDFVYSFTQEWPLFTQTHQLSYTIPYQFFSSNTIRGFGDVLIHYRYQLLTKDDWAAIAPRISVIIPSGDDSRGLGAGTIGAQCNIAMSKRVSEQIVVHLNAGVTTLPGTKGMDAAGNDVTSTLMSYNTGGSVIWLATRTLNIMLELVSNFSDEFDPNGEIVQSTETIISPGLRYAIDVGSLQIVPGLGVPFSINSIDARSGAFLYLSFEHPF